MMRIGGGCFRFMALLCLLLCRQTVWAAGPEAPPAGLEVRFVPDSAEVGSSVQLIANYRLPEGAQLPPDAQIKGLETLTVEGLHREKGKIRARVLVDQIGAFKTGPLSLAYLDREGKTQFLHAEPAELKVLSNLGERPEEVRLKPIYGIIPTRSGFMKHLLWVVITLSACAAGLGIFLWARRRRAGEGLSRDDVPPHTVAEKEIHALESQGLFEKGRVKEFYFRFSEILRHYLESLRGFPAAEYTTQEIAHAVQAPEDRRILPLLQGADLVKFADLNPTPARKNDELEQALAYIRETGSAFDRDHGDNGVHRRGIRAGRRRMIKREETAR